MTPLAKPARPLLWDDNGRPLLGNGALVDCPRRDANGAPDWETRRRITLDGWVKYDPGTREGAAPSAGGPGVGVTFSLTGGWSTTDPTRAGVIYADPEPVQDALGRVVRGPMGFGPIWEINRITEPSSSSPNNKDIIFGVVYWTGTADPTAATEMFGAGLGWTSTNTLAGSKRVTVISGTPTVSANSGNSNSGRAWVGFYRNSTTLYSWGVSNEAAAVSGASGIALSSSLDRLYRGIFMARLSTADGTTRTWATDLYVSGSAQGILR